MKVLVTGASGFMGKNLIAALVRDRELIISSIKARLLDFENTINEDIVIHLAGLAHDLKNTVDINEYYEVNTELTKKIFDAFLSSNARVFIWISSVKAVADKLNGQLTEDYVPNPVSHYGKSKLLAEQYIQSKYIPANKRVYVLRPCMIHGPGNKGNLNLLYRIISKGVPWPLGLFENKRSFCSIDNICFVIEELIKRNDIPSGVYNVADSMPVSTNEIVRIIADSKNKKPIILNIPKFVINTISKISDFLHLPLNSERLQKLTETYLVSNKKLLMALGKDLPVSSIDGLNKTFQSFNN